MLHKKIARAQETVILQMGCGESPASAVRTYGFPVASFLIIIGPGQRPWG
jgi:hypothetical protein